MAKSGTNLGQVDLSSYFADQLLADLPSSRGIWWPRVELTWVQLTCTHILQIYALVEASGGQEWNYLGSS